MALTKVSGGILDPGINVAGIVTATGFDGPFIGGSSKNIIAGIITATELDISGNIDVDGHTELDQLNVSGVSTFVGNIGGTPTFTGDVTFNGNVSIAQTLTYSDVTNIDSVGIVTAREGVRVPYDGTNSTRYISVGASDDLKIYHHASSFSFIENNTGILHLRSVDGIKLQDQNGSEMFVNCVDNGAVELYHDNSKKFETTASGATVTGDFVISDTNPRLTFTDTDHNPDYHIQVDGGSFEIKDSTNNRIKFQIDSNGHILIPRDDTYLKIGTGSDIQIYHTSNASYIQNGTGPLNIKSIAQDQDIVIQGNDGGSNISMLYFDTSETGNAEFSGDIKLQDGKKAKFGYSNDLSLGHVFINNSHNGVINNSTNVLFIESDTIVLRDKSGEGAETLAQFVKDGSCSLYNNNQKKLETTSTGISVTNDIKIPDGGKYWLGSDDDMYLNHSGSHSSIYNGTGNIYFSTQGHLYINVATNESAITATANGAVELYHNNVKKLETKSSGINVLGHVHATTTGSQVASGDPSAGASGAYLMLYHDGSNGFIQNGSGGITIRDVSGGNIEIQATDGETSIFCGHNGAVQLYYDNGKKLETNNDGVQITGSTGSFLEIRTSGAYDSGLVLTVNNNDSTDWSMRNDESDSNKLDFRYDGTRKMHLTSSGDLHLTGEVAASQDYPNFRPTLDFNFAAEKKLDSRITYTRTGPASYYDEFGKVVLVGDNFPRFDHDPDTRESKGLLIEESSTNEWGNSEALHNGTNGYTLPNGLTTPAGGSTAVKIPAGANNLWWSAGSGGFAVTSGDYWTMSWWAYSTIQSVDFGNPDYFYVSNTTISQDKTVPAGQWKRCFRTVQFNASGSPQIRFMPYSSTLYTDTNNEVFVWGFQFEKKQFPTSYIPTYGYATTRGDDDLIIDGEDLTDFHNQPEGTIIADYKVIAGDPEIFYLSNNGSSKRIGLYEAGTSQTRFLIGNSGTQADTTDSAGTTVGDNIKAAGAYKLNDVAAAKNGVISSTDTSVTIPDGIDRAYIGGYYDGTVQGVLGLRRLIYYPQRLPNSQLVTLTS